MFSVDTDTGSQLRNKYLVSLIFNLADGPINSISFGKIVDYGVIDEWPSTWGIDLAHLDEYSTDGITFILGQSLIRTKEMFVSCNPTYWGLKKPPKGFLLQLWL